eukprot:symbB.v1.2.026610.t1/scaffold2674.1/size119956/2
MHAFLCHVQEVVSFLRRSTSLQLPFKIEKDKVGGFSVKGSHFDQERWTKALKFMLLDLKYLIAVVESRDFASSRTACVIRVFFPVRFVSSPQQVALNILGQRLPPPPLSLKLAQLRPWLSPGCFSLLCRCSSLLWLRTKDTVRSATPSLVATPKWEASPNLRTQLWVLGATCTVGLVLSVGWMIKTTPGKDQ